MQTRLAFGPFVLDPANRLLLRDGQPVEIGGRYFDALLLLAREPGRLITKDRFHEEVWRGIPVTDEALTQCIRTLRRQLGDDATAARYIETVPKHGYRFVAPVERLEDAPADPPPPRAFAAPPPPALPATIPLHAVLLALAGTLGGAVAGLFGGLIYGSLGASQPLASGMNGGMGATSVLLVLMALTVVVGLAGGAGVSFGLAAAQLATRQPGPWWIAGAAVGGLLVGGGAELLGLDAFNLLLGQAPRDITGAGEGALLGAGVGLGAWAAMRRPDTPLLRGLALAALTGAVAGTLVPLLGGRLMAGSLDLLATEMPGSRLRLDRIGALLGEDGFGPLSQIATAAFEGALFTAGVVGAVLLARRWVAAPADYRTASRSDMEGG